MIGLNQKLAQAWTLISPRVLPFADAITAELPLSRLLLNCFNLGWAASWLRGSDNRLYLCGFLTRRSARPKLVRENAKNASSQGARGASFFEMRQIRPFVWSRRGSRKSTSP